MKYKYIIWLALLGLLAAGAGFCLWRIHDAPRRESLSCLTQVDAALQSGHRAALVDLVVVPAAMQNRTSSEQAEFLAKALTDETSPDGLAALRRHGTFGTLRELFPAEAEAWASQAGVEVENCVAFKLEQPGLRTEVVLVKPLFPGGRYRIVRLNNVKQLAALNVSTPEKPQ